MDRVPFHSCVGTLHAKDMFRENSDNLSGNFFRDWLSTLLGLLFLSIKEAQRLTKTGGCVGAGAPHPPTHRTYSLGGFINGRWWLRSCWGTWKNESFNAYIVFNIFVYGLREFGICQKASNSFSRILGTSGGGLTLPSTNNSAFRHFWIQWNL